MDACHERIECNRLKDDFAPNGPSISDQRAEKCPSSESSPETPVNDEPNAECDRDQWLKKVQGVDVLHDVDRKS